MGPDENVMQHSGHLRTSGHQHDEPRENGNGHIRTPYCWSTEDLSNLHLQVVPIVVGATGLITDSLVTNVKKILGAKKVEETVSNLQKKALIGSMRVLKSALAMKPS